MQVNWFTVIAQVLNFLILVWLLKRFLYKPVLNAIDEREKRISSQIKDAEAKEAKANKEQDDFRKKNETFDKEKKGLMDKAVAETEKQRQKLLEAARDEAAALSSKLEKALIETQENLSHNIVQKTQLEVFDIARKTLTDLASQSLEEQSASVFIDRLDKLSKDEKTQFSKAFKSGSDPVLVRTAFDLPSKQQTEIKNAVDEILGAKTKFQFETSPELISGIELSANGYKLEWSITAYLNSLQKNISETLKAETMHNESSKPYIEKPEQTPIEAPQEKPTSTPLQAPIETPSTTPITTPVKTPITTPKEAPETKSE